MTVLGCFIINWISLITSSFISWFSFCEFLVWTQQIHWMPSTVSLCSLQSHIVPVKIYIKGAISPHWKSFIIFCWEVRVPFRSVMITCFLEHACTLFFSVYTESGIAWVWSWICLCSTFVSLILLNIFTKNYFNWHSYQYMSVLLSPNPWQYLASFLKSLFVCYTGPYIVAYDCDDFGLYVHFSDCLLATWIFLQSLSTACSWHWMQSILYSLHNT